MSTPASSRRSLLATGRMRAVARLLQTEAWTNPHPYAPDPGRSAGDRHFARVDRELTWGLTLNK